MGQPLGQNAAPTLSTATSTTTDAPTRLNPDESQIAGRSVVLFDGVCNVCNGLVQFVIPRDPGNRFAFASLQSPFGQTMSRRFGLPTENFDTVALIDWRDAGRPTLHTRSGAIARLLLGLGGGWAFLGALLWLIPAPLRDVGYALFAKYRYKLFGQREQCLLPTPEIRARFLDNAVA
jgi:predicted DCC family thiol-disulfide oxidoreductase YuxK